MKMINQRAISRGSILIDYALSLDGEEMALEVADMIGLVAAYIASGQCPSEMEARLSEALTPTIGRQAAHTFTLFEDQDGRGLWSQGPAINDVAFTHPKLKAAFPNYVPLRDREPTKISAILGRWAKPY